MIRRPHRDETWLIRQSDRCAIAAALAERVGNQQFLAVSPRVIRAVSLLDAGWTDLDETPGDVIDGSELDRAVILDLWQRSGELAAEADAYAGLLVTLSGFWKSISAGGSGLSQWDSNETRVRFDLNRFQHTMIELLEALRTRLGLRIDKPLRFGLAEQSRDPAEVQLRADFAWVQFFDRLSEWLCRGRAMSSSLAAPPRGSNQTTELHLEIADTRAMLNPWPFDRARFEVPLIYRTFGKDVAAPPKTVAIELAAFTI